MLLCLSHIYSTVFSHFVIYYIIASYDSFISFHLFLAFRREWQKLRNYNSLRTYLLDHPCRWLASVFYQQITLSCCKTECEEKSLLIIPAYRCVVPFVLRHSSEDSAFLIRI